MFSIKNTLIADQKLKLEGSGSSGISGSGSGGSGVQSFISSSAPLIDFFNSSAGTSRTSYEKMFSLPIDYVGYKGLVVKG